MLHRSKKRTVQTGRGIATGSDECQPTSERRDKNLQKIERNSSKSGFHKYVMKDKELLSLAVPGYSAMSFLNKHPSAGDFPGGKVAKTPCSQNREPRFHP